MNKIVKTDASTRISPITLTTKGKGVSYLLNGQRAEIIKKGMVYIRDHKKRIAL